MVNIKKKIIKYIFLKTATEKLDSNFHLVTTVLVEAIQGSEGSEGGRGGARMSVLCTML